MSVSYELLLKINARVSEEYTELRKIKRQQELLALKKRADEIAFNREIEQILKGDEL